MVPEMEPVPPIPSFFSQELIIIPANINDIETATHALRCAFSFLNPIEYILKSARKISKILFNTLSGGNLIF